jgi:hypothetical protein
VDALPLARITVGRVWGGVSYLQLDWGRSGLERFPPYTHTQIPQCFGVLSAAAFVCAVTGHKGNLLFGKLPE